MTVRILVGDVRDRLAELPDRSVQCVVTSPPYMGLRDYGTAQWDGGDPACDHAQRSMKPSQRSTLEDHGADGRSPQLDALPAIPYRDQCGKCGATRVDQQIGLESTLAEYVDTLVQVFREVRRVLRDDGTVFLNIGDSYCSTAPGTTNAPQPKGSKADPGQWANYRPKLSGNLKPKDLMMVPARLALALQDDGWYLRSDIIWAKPNPMPESVTDRPTSAHEHIFLLTKSRTYYYDADAIRDRAVTGERFHGAYSGSGRSYQSRNGRDDPENVVSAANARNVWTIATAPYKEAHFATFPPELPRRCILAGTSEKGACPACGAPWVRCVERTTAVPARCGEWKLTGTDTRGDIDRKGGFYDQRSETLGWQPSCGCDAGDPVPCVVLDPFAGAGTTLLVADQLGRDAVGVELNPAYAALIERRLREDAPMFAEVVTAPMLAQGVLL